MPIPEMQPVPKAQITGLRRPSAVSQVLRALSETPVGTETWTLQGLPDGCSPFRVRVAADRKTRERAYRLAFRLYLERGYVSASQEARIVSAFDLHPDTLTLLAEDTNGQELATVSLVFDSARGLPSDEIFGEELGALRASNLRLVEVTRLAISDAYGPSKALLIALFNLCFVFGRRVMNFDHSVIEVNPRHVKYYSRMFHYEATGPLRACPRVNGAPAQLLGLDLAVYDREIRRVGGQGVAAAERSLYAHFHPPETEQGMVRFLQSQQRPMSKGDARYFGLTENIREVATAVGQASD